MKIRDLNGSGNELKIIDDFQGDVYVTITSNKRSEDVSVRLGGSGSGHFIPPPIMRLLHQLAAEFRKYEHCRYEEEANDEYIKENYD